MCDIINVMVGVKMKQTKSELHTHLLGMLSARELLQMVSEYVDFIYWPLDHAVNEESRLVSVKELLNSDYALPQLQIKHGDQVDNEELDAYYRTRTSIIAFLNSILYLSNGKKNCKFHELINDNSIKEKIIKYYDDLYEDKSLAYIMALLNYVKEDKKINKQKRDSVLKYVYSDYLNRSLRELIKMDCKYVEISYSSESIISLIDVNSEIMSKIKCKFLLSTDREGTVKDMKQSVRALQVGIEKGMVVGFDIMGQELALLDREKMYSQSNRSFSFKRKLELLVDALKASSNGMNTLRIHSGETKDSFGNTEWVLNALLEIKTEYEVNNPSDKILPPPEIRIGHGIYFDKNNSNYIENLKKLGAIIEINASSNLALSNIDTYDQLPYDYYLKNGVPIVLSTDGHGLYDTSLQVEDFIASKVSKYYDLIEKIDSRVLEGKIKK